MQAGRLNEIYDQYRDRVAFFCIYIQEAHPEDEWQVLPNISEGVVYTQPKTEGERAAVAEACVLHLNLRMPMLLDEMNNAVDSAYAALPERLYVIDTEGRICYRSEPGPWGFTPDAWEKAIQEEAVR